MYRYFKLLTNTPSILSWQSKGLSNENIDSPPTTSLSPSFNYVGNKIRVKFTGSCLKQPKISYTPGKVVNIYIVHELGASSSNANDPKL